jgi:hypothetical protein
MKRNIFLIYIFCWSGAYAQPYLDLGKISYLYSPLHGLNKKTNPLRSNLYNINLSLPVELQKNGDALLINPFFEHNEGRVADRQFHVVSEGLSLGFLNKLHRQNWSIYTAFILRRNKEAEKQLANDWQYGGVILSSYEKNRFITLKFGLYYNKEFFGNYFMPLAGLYWKINNKNLLFGVLPGNMTYEHKMNERFYLGTVFRAFTSSYRRETIDPCFGGDCTAKNYLRIDDNQLGIFEEVYLMPKIVFGAEAGYTVLRRYRFASKGEHTHTFTNYKNDNFYLKLTVAYRLHFR